MEWQYTQPVRIVFGEGKLNEVFSLVQEMGHIRAFLVCDPFLIQNGAMDRLRELGGDAIVGVYTGVQANPTLDSVDTCAAMVRESGADVLIAMGGGSAMDCAKAAAVMAKAGGAVRTYHGTGTSLPRGALPWVAVPTTAGTGSEVTCVSVLSDPDRGVKAPILSSAMYARLAVIDPELTYTMPRMVTAQTGLDALSHAMEGYYSKNHQPVTDALAIAAARKVFLNLRTACDVPEDRQARAEMAAASVMAGLAFNLPKTGPSHACSFVLTNRYHIPHGEACALTLDTFARIIGKGDLRMDGFAKQTGFADVEALCEAIVNLKRDMGVRTDLKDLQLDDEALEQLVKDSHHPNILNSPVPITDKILRDMYRAMR